MTNWQMFLIYYAVCVVFLIVFFRIIAKYGYIAEGNEDGAAMVAVTFTVVFPMFIAPLVLFCLIVGGLLYLLYIPGKLFARHVLGFPV
jgi:hypothetical protein